MKYDAGDEMALDSFIKSRGTRLSDFPVMSLIYDDLKRIVSSSLRDSFSSEVTVGEFQVKTCKEYVEEFGSTGFFCKFAIPDGGCHGFTHFCDVVSDMMLNVTMGGEFSNDKSESKKAVEGEVEITQIERAVFIYITVLLFGAFTESIATICRLTTDKNTSVLDTKLVDIFNDEDVLFILPIAVSVGGKIEVVIPLKAVEYIQDNAGGIRRKEKMDWSQHFIDTVRRSEVAVEAVLGTILVSMNDLHNIHVGKTFVLGDSEVILKANDKAVFTGDMGCSGDKIAVRISSKLE